MTTQEHGNEHEHDADLGKAFRAVRDRYDGTHAEPDATLRRALLASRTDVRRRRLTRWVILPLAATLAASTAWAGVTGRLTPTLSSIGEVFRGEHAPRTTAAPTRSSSSVPTAATQPSAVAANEAQEAPPAEEAPLPEPPPTRQTPSTQETPSTAIGSPTQEVAPTQHAAPAQHAPATQNAPPSPSSERPTSAQRIPSESSARTSPTPRATASAADPNAALFEEAHRLHFQAHDPARALVAWDRYLAAAPNGRFAPEARYNRALTLVRLGRHDEAKSALEAFANGSFGEYRRADARALLEALARDH